MLSTMLFLSSFIGCESSERLDALEKRVADIEDEIRDLKKDDDDSKPSKKGASSIGAMFGGYKNMRGEVPMNLKGIKTAQIAYEGSFDTFVTIAPYPRKSSGKKTKQWVRGASGGFMTVGWSPDGDVRGTYWVTTTTTNFTAWGIIDVDGDGKFATYTATISENPNAPITPPDVY